MNEGLVERPLSYTRAIALWHVLLRDEDALLKCPGAHHKALLSQAHALHRDQVISSANSTTDWPQLRPRKNLTSCPGLVDHYSAHA